MALVLSLALLATGTARGEVAQHEDLRVGIDAQLRPRVLPRTGFAPARVDVSGRNRPLDGSLPPRLRTIGLALSRHGRIDPGAVPVCSVTALQPSTTEDARRICGRSLVGEGEFRAKVLLPEQSPFPSRGRVLAFNGRYRGRPAVLAHVYGTRPAPISFTLPFLLGRGHGSYGATLTASLPRSAGRSAYVTGLSISLGGGGGEDRGTPYLGAACPASRNLSQALFPLLRASFAFAGAPTLRSTIMRGAGSAGERPRRRRDGAAARIAAPWCARVQHRDQRRRPGGGDRLLRLGRVAGHP